MLSKPKQTKPVSNNDAGTLYDALSIALEYVSDAMEELRGYAEFAEWFSFLDNLYDEMYTRVEELEVCLQVQRDEMIRDLTREYYRGLL